MRKTLLLSLVLFFVPGILTAQTGEANRIIDLHRKIVLVLDEASSRDDANLVRVARYMYARKQELLGELEDILGEPRRLEAFIDHVSEPTLDPADRLAFTDLVEELRDPPVARRGSSSLDELDRELTEIRLDFGEEARTTRGAGGRPNWRAYLSDLRRSLSLEDILREFPLEPAPGERGAYGEHATFGYGLPDKHVVLTFDDGPHARYTEAILATLQEHGATAYFFTVGRNLGRHREGASPRWTKASLRARLAHEAGHVLANHSYSHRQMPKLSPEERGVEIAHTNELLEAMTGEPPGLFRPPYGDTSRELTDEFAGLGMSSVLWNVDSWDWGDPIPESIAKRVVEKVEKARKGILLFHDVHKQTVAALPMILRELHARGFRFSTLEGQIAVPPQPVTSLDSFRSGRSGTSAGSAAPAYRKSWAVVIGINAYRHWPRLSYAVNDAHAIENALSSQFGFEKESVFVLLDDQATRENIVEVFSETLSDGNRVDREDRVFVFFAGHGATRKLPSGSDLGYIVPVDADFQSYPVRSISMTQLKEFSQLIPAKHVYFVMDSCYSGIALTRGGSPGTYIEEVTQRATRQILTAGGADETVADGGPGGHSIFTWTFLQGLSGLADLDGNGVVTATELGAFTAPIVSQFSSQTPSFGNLEGSEGGEFVFELELESLSAVSRQLDDDALAMNAELDRLQKELSVKLERNLRLHQEVERLRSEDSDVTREERIAQANRHHALGLQYFREKRYEQALDELSRAVALNPANPTIVNNYGFVLYRLERYEDSIPWFERTIELEPERAVVYVNLADALFELGRERESHDYYRRYLEIWPATPRREEIEKLIGGSPR